MGVMPLFFSFYLMRGVKMKKLLKKLKKYVGFQIFDTPNWVGDKMIKIWEKDGKAVLVCEKWEYIEALGFTKKQLKKIRHALK